jgi:hypothetical protein
MPENSSDGFDGLTDRERLSQVSEILAEGIIRLRQSKQKKQRAVQRGIPCLSDRERTLCQ